MQFAFTENCGTLHIHGTGEFNPNTPRQFFTRFRDQAAAFTRAHGRRWSCPGIAIFTDAKNYHNETTRGDMIASQIRKLKLGYVTAGNYTRNPNTNRLIKAWVWNVNAAELRRLR